MIFEERETLEVKIDPRVKLLFLILFFLICLFPSKLYSSLALFLLSLIVSFSMKAIKNVLRAKFVLSMVFIFTVILWLISKGFGYMERAISIAFKLDSMIVGGIIFLSITRQEELFFALRKFFIPFKPSFAISLSMRFVPIILNLIETVVQAQKARGYELSGNPFKRAKKIIPLIGPVLLYVLRWTDKLSIALEARGFSSENRIDYYEWRMSLKDYFLLSISLLLFAFLVFLRIKDII
jgi:energy-coupling factor transport system permease protein